MLLPFTLPRSTQEAIRIQNDLRAQVRLEDDFGPVRTVAGIDVGYDLQKNLSKAALVVMDFEALTVTREIIEYAPTEFPYVPGLLSFREVPVILKALAQLPEMPDLLFIDGQGIAHPRRLGIAAHIGVLTGLPTVGVAKSRLCGKHGEPGPEKGMATPLTDKGEQIGYVLRSRNNCKPLFISPGHRVSHASALAMVQRCLARYRLPEPTRLADKLSKTVKEQRQECLLLQD